MLARASINADAHPLDRRTTFHVDVGARDGAVLAHSLLTTERHRMAQDDARRHRTTRGSRIRAWPHRP
jgi:hypothetical protein